MDRLELASKINDCRLKPRRSVLPTANREFPKTPEPVVAGSGDLTPQPSPRGVRCIPRDLCFPQAQPLKICVFLARLRRSLAINAHLDAGTNQSPHNCVCADSQHRSSFFRAIALNVTEDEYFAINPAQLQRLHHQGLKCLLAGLDLRIFCADCYRRFCQRQFSVHSGHCGSHSIAP